MGFVKRKEGSRSACETKSANFDERFGSLMFVESCLLKTGTDSWVSHLAILELSGGRKRSENRGGNESFLRVCANGIQRCASERRKEGRTGNR